MQAKSNPPKELHPAFNWLKSERIDSLNLNIEIYEHKKTGAMHYHLDADNDENVFLVALRTVPTDSTGVAHILEHTALCGSERYQVRDPFFMMIRRSLNTFMNAFTSTDWTAYPFASQNRKDFNNLLDVYLDAVFFSRLHELDFKQEGHRLEFAESDNPNSDLLFKGVVFNEMKGAMSSAVSTVWQTMTKYLFPSTTYHFNSGGEPTDIPDLSYEQLKAFYSVHYHPSNAIFMTFGNISAVEHQAKFEQQVLSRFERLERTIEVNNEKRYYSPLAVEEAYAIDEQELIGDKSHLVMGWLLGSSVDLEQQLKAQLLSNVLLDSSASPLMQALEISTLGSAPSPLCGLEDSNKEMSFVCGLEGCASENAEEFEKLIMGVLREVAEKGVDKQLLEAVLHQLELSQREIGGDHYPYGLQLILSGLSTAIHRGDVVSVMDIDRVLDNLREEIKEDDFIQKLVKQLLLDNPHRVRLTMKPDSTLAQRKEEGEKQQLAAIKAALSEQQKAQIIASSKALEERQNQEDDESILPKVGIEDVPKQMHFPDYEQAQEENFQLTTYAQGTNGLVYQQIIIDIPKMDDELQLLLPTFCQCMTEVGCAEKDYIETQLWHSSVSGGINAFTSMRGDIDNEQKIKGYFVLSGKALNRNHDNLSDLLKMTLEKVRFDELDRVKELIAQIRARKEQSITGSGHQLAMLASASEMSPVAWLSHNQRGMAGIKSIKQLNTELEESQQQLEKLCEQFKAIHALLLAAPRQFLLIAEEHNLVAQSEALKALWKDSNMSISNAHYLELAEKRNQVKQFWQTSTQVNFCSKAYPSVTVEHPDAAALTVLGGFLKNGYLHRAIREQGGAYGGGATQDNINACFKFYSYRDPRLSETLNDFDQSIQWLLTTEHEYRVLEEAILGVVSSLDKPSSPAGDAKLTFQNILFGRTPEQREQFRSRVLDVTLDDLKRVAKTYFEVEQASIAVISNAQHAEECESLGLETHLL